MPKTILAEVSGFTPIIDEMAEAHGLVYAAVFGRMWRYCQMSDGVCKASLETISKGLGINRATVLRYADRLVEDGYLKDITPDLRNKPHVYSDTGKASIKIGIGATVAQSNVTVAQSNVKPETVAQCNATVAESYLKKDIKKQVAKIDSKTHTAAETWERVLVGLHQHYNGTFDSLNPSLYSCDERPARLTVTINHSDPSLANRIRTLAKTASGKTWQVKVVVNPPVVCGAALPLEQQQINALKVAYDQLTGGTQYFDGDDKEAFRFLVQRGVDAARLTAIYKHLKSQTWRTGRIAPRTLADNYLEVKHDTQRQPDPGATDGSDRQRATADDAAEFARETAALINASADTV